MEELGKLAIITDGSLPEDTRASVDKVIPFFVLTSNGEIRGDKISVSEFYDLQRTASSLPSTAMVRVVDFLQEFESLYKKGFKLFVVLTVPENKSGTFFQAQQAADLFKKQNPDTDFLIFDTGTTAGGVEFMVEAVNSLRGENLYRIVTELKSLRGRIELFLALDTVRYIGASGRIEALSRFKLSETLQRYARGLAAWFAATTKRSPKVLLTFNQGKEKIVGIGRTYYGLEEKIVDQIEERIKSGKKLKEMLIFHSDSEQGAERLAAFYSGLPSGRCETRTDVSIALRSITGPKFIAVFCLYE